MPEATHQPLLDLKPNSHAKAEGAFIAFAAGDALGWPQELRSNRGRLRPTQASVEFRRWTRRDGGRFQPYEVDIEAGEYSDDTQLTLAIARCRKIEDPAWWHAWTRIELPLWTLYQRGGGGATRRAAANWVKGVPPWKNSDEKSLEAYFAAGGNGVAMRVLPHAIVYARHAQTTGLLRDVILDGVATHGHPRALVGATAYAYTAWWLLRLEQALRFGELVEVLLDGFPAWSTFPENRNGWMEAANRASHGEYERQWHQVAQEMRILLEEVRRGLSNGAIADDQEILEKLGCFGGQKGSGTISTAAAIYLCARYAAQPSQGILRAAFATGADTDTLAAMTGGLMGCLAGTDWLPREWLKVQDCQYLRQLAVRLSSKQDSRGENLGNLRNIGQQDLERILSELKENRPEDFDFDGVRKARVVNLLAPKPLASSINPRIWKLKASDGQILFIARVTRQARSQLAPLGDASQNALATSLKNHDRAEAVASGVKIGVADMIAASGFYERAFGLSPVKQESHYISYGALALVPLSDAFELLRSASGGEAPAKESAGAFSSQIRIEIQVNDLQETLRRVEAQGGRIVQGMVCMPWGERAFLCLDPEGNLVEVVERT